jgi:hypothetical protein
MLTLGIRIDCKMQLTVCRVCVLRNRKPRLQQAAIYATADQHETLFCLIGLRSKIDWQLHDRRSKRDSGCRQTLTMSGCSRHLRTDSAALSRSQKEKSVCVRVNQSGSRPTISRSGGRAWPRLLPVNAVFLVGLAVPAIVVDVKVLTGRRQ